MGKQDTVTLKLRVGSHEYLLRLDELTSRITRKVRAATGVSLMKAIQTVDSDPDLDLIMTIFYAAALQADPDTEFDKLETQLGITYSSEIIIEPVEDDQGEA